MSYPSYSASGTRRPAPASTNPFDDTEPRQPTEQEKVISQILDVQQESRSSTQRSLALLYQTEEIGVTTAKELVEQGEKLTKIEGNVTQIDNGLKESQKHINGLKSVFGGISNWFQSRKEKKGSKEEPTNLPSNSTQNSSSGMKKSESEHSTLSSRTSSSSNQYKPTSRVAGTSVHTVIEQNEIEIEEDLEQMSDLTLRLKMMATQMGAEIEKQNSQLDRINDRVAKTETTITGQNKQMSNILKK